MEMQDGISKIGMVSDTPSRNLSSSSSTFVSALQSPFFSPRSPNSREAESVLLVSQNDSKTSSLTTDGTPYMKALIENKPLLLSPPILDKEVQATKNCNEGSSPDFTCDSSHCVSSVSNCSQGTSYGYSDHGRPPKKPVRNSEKTFTQHVNFLSSNGPRSCDVFIGFHGQNPSLLRFARWLRAELELQGVSCFMADRARRRNSRTSKAAVRAMSGATIGVVIITKKTFGNPFSIEELQCFLDKKNLIPIFFDLSPTDCLARDIIEKRGALWERHGGELWMLYGGPEKDWREAIDGISRVDDGKFDAHDGNWRNCILNIVILLASRLGRRSIVDRVNRWMEKVAREEFPFPRNENFVGRKKELSELELILFGDVSGEGKREYIEFKSRHRRRNLVIGSPGYRARERVKESGKGKEPVIWKESDREIEMQRVNCPRMHCQLIRRHARTRLGKIVHGKGIACVTGASGIGKTELLLEFSYKIFQRYKMVLWIGGESRYIRQNFLSLRSFLDVDVSVEGPSTGKGRVKGFEEQEEEAISRLKNELMRDIPYLVIIDNLESEKDWWDNKLIVDLLPLSSAVTHFLISTRLPQVMNLEPIKLRFLSGVEAMSLMNGRHRDYSLVEIDAFRVLEEKLGRLTLGLAIVGAVISELPINPSRLLHIIDRMPLQDFQWSGREAATLEKLTFLMYLLDVCFSVLGHAERLQCLASRMAQAGGWFGPYAIPISLLAIAAHKLPKKHHKYELWRSYFHGVTCGFTESQTKRSEVEAASALVRFGLARSSTKHGCIHFHEIIRLYARKRGPAGVSLAMVQAVSLRGCIPQHLDHMWAACFLAFRFGSDPWVVELKAAELLLLINRVVIPLAVHTFMTFSRCTAALELLCLCTNALEAAEEPLVSRSEKWLDMSLCWRPVKSNAQLNPYLWQELALTRATVLETRAKLMIRGGGYDVGDTLIRKVIFIRNSICGANHPDTVSAQNTLGKITRLLTNVEG